MPDRVMSHGSFYGALEAGCAVSAFDVAVRTADPVRAVERHSHEAAHFVLVLDGLYVTAARGAAAHATGPTLIYNPPHVTHRDRFEHDGTKFRGRFMTVSTPMVHEGFTGPFVVQGDGVVRALELCQRCLAGGTDLVHAVDALVVELVGSIEPDGHDERTLPPWLRRSLLRLGDVGEAPTVAELAADAGVHPVHFARTFRQFMDRTPADFMRARRVERAIGLLRHTPRPLIDIAISCGFVDQSHLTRAVRRATGVTPGVIRGGTPPT